MKQFAVVNEEGRVFYGAALTPAIFETRERAETVAAYFNNAYGPLHVEEKETP